MSSSSSRPSKRILFVDLARAVAVLFMIQGHTLAVLLAPGLEETVLFKGWLYLRGLTSCGFLLLSGFSFTIATARYRAEYQVFSPRLRRRLVRFTTFLVLGYAMRIPVRPISRLPQVTLDQWQAFAAVDVLQLVAVTLLALQALTWITRSQQRFAIAAATAGALIVLLSPLAWTAGWVKALPLFVASYFTPSTGSIFPLFPWAAYILFGAALGVWYLQFRERRSDAEAARVFLYAGVSMIVAGVAFYLLPLRPYGPIDFWKISPNLFLVKAGSVLGLLAAAVGLTLHLNSLPYAVTVLARESLTVYFVHLCVLYGSIWNDGLFQRIGPHLGLPATVLWAAGMLFAMSLLAYVWHECKQRSWGASALIRTALTIGAVYIIA
jgi:uncharacterized membrane protein